MSFPNHCTKGIPTIKGFPLSNVFEGQQPTAHYGWKVELDGDATIFTGPSLCKLNMPHLLKKIVTYF